MPVCFKRLGTVINKVGQVRVLVPDTKIGARQTVADVKDTNRVVAVGLLATVPLPASACTNNSKNSLFSYSIVLK